MNTEWNKAVRRTLRVPFRTHTNLLSYIVKSKNFSDQHLNRVRKFLHSFSTSKNLNVQLIGKRARENTIGALGRNRARCEVMAVRSISSQLPDVTLLATAQSIRNLVDVRDNLVALPGFNREDISSMLESLCCC